MGNKKVFLILAVVFGLLGSFMTYNYVKGATETATVYEFKQDTDAKVLTASDFQAVELPVSAVPNDAVTDLSIVEGKSLQHPVLAGTILRLPMLVETSESRMSGKLLEFNNANVRAIAIPYSLETSVGSTVKTGDFINIYALDSDLKTVVEIARRVEVIRGVPDVVENTNNKEELSIIVAFRNDEEVEKYGDQLAKGSSILVSLLPMTTEDVMDYMTEGEAQEMENEQEEKKEYSGKELAEQLKDMGLEDDVEVIEDNANQKNDNKQEAKE